MCDHQSALVRRGGGIVHYENYGWWILRSFFALPFLLIWCVWETQHVLCMLNKSADFLGFFLPFTVRTGQFAYVLHLICFDALLCFWLNRGWCVDHVYIVRHTSNSTVFRPNWLEAIYRQRLRNSQHHGFSRLCVCVCVFMNGSGMKTDGSSF